MEDDLATWCRRVEICTSQISAGSRFAKFWAWYRSLAVVVVKDISDFQEPRIRNQEMEIREFVWKLELLNEQRAWFRSQGIGMPRARRLSNGKVRLLNG